MKHIDLQIKSNENLYIFSDKEIALLRALTYYMIGEDAMTDEAEVLCRKIFHRIKNCDSVLNVWK